MFEIVNTTDRADDRPGDPELRPAATPRSYFQKLECFCFTQADAAAGRGAARCRCVFVVDPALPADVDTITLSYTFFEVEGAANRGNAASRHDATWHDRTRSTR